MNTRDRHSIKHAAELSLNQSQQDMRQILLIYLLIITGLSLGASALTVILSYRIADTGGLSNMGLRSILSTAQTILPLIQLLVLWGLQIGYHTAALDVVRGKSVSRDTLFGGFRRFFPLLRALLMQGFLYCMAALVSIYLASYIFLMLPASADFQKIIMPAIQSASILSGSIMLDEATVMAASEAMLPVLWIFAALYLVLFVPMYYRYRMVMYRLIDHNHPRALAAMLESRGMMHRSRFALLKLDLSFWWFYALQLLIPLVCYGDSILALAGITLPIPELASYFLFLILSLALQFALFYFSMNRVAVSYAVFYDTLLAEKTAQAELLQRSRPPVLARRPWRDPYEEESGSENENP